jgi:hypothetical protein
LNKYDSKSTLKYYGDFIDSNSYDVILLAGGVDAKNVIEIYDKYKPHIKGFGELLCYDNYNGNKLPYKNLEWVKTVLDYNKDNLPVFIHYSLTDDMHYNEFDDLLYEYSNTPIVLCHCGLPNKNEGDYTAEYDTIFKRFISLQIKHNNLYTDICDGAAKYIKKNPDKLFDLISDRVILGTDIAQKHLDLQHNTINTKKINDSVSRFNLYGKYINNDTVIKKLFNI